ncbi:hypothetical protein PVK06_020676 [Gossypium arboreum]|uniref:UBN2 domain-containing protein n=1 Tax=Gossypium arboreum TaxID=29729 RepID=A0ABR0PNP9_GOSAR|nr:hypothetical protein PVK06_020676 [Gossypium arboreum]
MDGPSIPIKQEEELFIPKSKKKWNEECRRSIQLNAKTMHTLFCALGLKEYNRVSSYSNAKQIWDKLEVTHQGISQVKKSKVGILTLTYETFKMKPKEYIKAMYNQFTIITNGLNSCGKTYLNEEVVKKMLKSLSKSWEAKVTTIEEAKNLETLTLDELIGYFLIR